MDIGGTWFRVLDNGIQQKTPSPSKLNKPTTPSPELYRRLVEKILDAAPSAGTVAISLGAATDDVENRILGSGPLWGNWTPPHDLLQALERERPDLNWSVFNDVSCSLAHFAKNYGNSETRHIGFLTVSSGIALRIANLESGTIVVDSSGTQGEVGHLRLPLHRDTRTVQGLTCECGGEDHIASVSSGPGIRRSAEALNMPDFTPEGFVDALNQRNDKAQKLLDTVTAPIAELLRTVWTVKPEVGLIGIGGGVPEALSEHYDQALRRHLSQDAGYASLDPRIWEQGFRTLSAENPVSNLQGAQLLAQGYLLIKKSRTLTHAR
ncbi:ROK family protein [Glutamicibacter sp. TV12E]|uniref:ROK family protein n=1 Tax=Glutamicibacter sp. TV12E TaxID=3446362 RepID=UPI0040336814